MGADLICSTLGKIEKGELERIPQDESLATFAPIIKKEMGNIDFNMDAISIRNLIRGFDPWPSAFTFWNGKRLKVMSATVLDTKTNEEPAVVIGTEGGLCVACGNDTALRFDRVQLEGSKAMTSEELLRGHNLNKGMKLGE